MNKAFIHSAKVSKLLLMVNVVVALVYFSWWLDFAHAGNWFFYGLLFVGEVYHVSMALLFWHTAWPAEQTSAQRFLQIPPQTLFERFHPNVDIFIPVVSEPLDVVEYTALCAKNMRYSNHTVFILNDGRVAKKESWMEYEKLATRLGIECITRTVPGGAKAGNINNALAQTKGDIVVIFDADMAPHADFLEKMIPYFKEKSVGFIQSPQYYKNADANYIAGGAWEQQELFFGPIMVGKEKSQAAFICGTNVAIRRTALMEAGGMCEDNIAEDFLTSLSIHQNGWKSYYVPEVLAEGYAPEDLLSYYKQQLRWARGSLEVLFSENPLFKSGLTWRQKVEYLSSALYYFNGAIVLIDAILPIAALAFGVQPVAGTTISFAFYFLPFMFLNLYTLYKVTDHSVTFRAISFSMSSWTLQLQALKSVLLKQKMAFAVTPKQAQEGNFLFLAYPHLLYAGIIAVAAVVGINREGLTPSVITNITWGVFNIIMFVPYIYAAYNWKGLFKRILGVKTTEEVIRV